MKFLCLECDEVMGFAERQLPGDGTLAAVFTCPSCSREMAMLTNPMETQFVSSMGIKIGGAEVPAQPMESIRTSLEGGRGDVFVEEAPRTASVEWSPEAIERLSKVPSFVRGMVKRIYTDYARERGIRSITPVVMDTARSELGLEGM
jgi:hypothetical protein